jgi:branched-chain amino acid transport system permease protein
MDRRPAYWRYTPLLVLGVFAIGFGLLVDNSFYLRIAALVWAMGIAAVGLNMLMGEAGQVSLGHAAFIGIGSYTVAIGPAQFGLDPLFCVLIGLFLSCAIALVIGRPILRLEGYYLSVATLGLGYLVSLVIVSETALTGGPDGLAVPRATVFSVRLAGAGIWYWICAACLGIAVLLAINLQNSPTGRAFRSLHDSETAAAALGIDVGAKKLVAFVLAAAYGSFAGSLIALMNGFAAPANASFIQSIELVAMVVIGGSGSVLGAVVGAAVLVVLSQVFVSFHDYETLLIGLMIMLFMIFLRRGIVPGLAHLVGAR